MKKKTALIFGLSLIVLSVFASSIVFGYGLKELPRLTTICESKVGGVLFGIDDGFSTLKFCPKNSRKVLLSDTLVVPSKVNEDILFAYYYDPAGGMTKKMLLFFKNGDVYGRLDGDSNWVLEYKVPESIMANEVIEWRYDYLRTRDGKIYYCNLLDKQWVLLTDLPTPTI